MEAAVSNEPQGGSPSTLEPFGTSGQLPPDTDKPFPLTKILLQRLLRTKGVILTMSTQK